ncbi:AAA family ATPase [Desulfobacterales bacterium HSG2]|nr:AAA family ATPase [Desulfobacterales bacterium HSG2]
MINNIEICNFTVFDQLKIDLVPGINLFIGDNGTGKTHLLKLIYLQGVIDEHDDPGAGISEIFLPHNRSLQRLIRKREAGASLSVGKNGETFSIHITEKTPRGTVRISGIPRNDSKPVYIPAKEMLANAPGFRSLHATREIHFERVCSDIIDRAFLPRLKKTDPRQKKLMDMLEKGMGGEITAKNEEFYLKSRTGDIEFTLVAEGIRKLALLRLLIENGSLDGKSLLCWDEPETNLNPSMIPLVVSVMTELEQMGAQIFIATHSYVLLKEFELQRGNHSLRFYSLSKNDKDSVSLSSSGTYPALFPNRIADQFARMYNLEIGRALGGNNE